MISTLAYIPELLLASAAPQTIKLGVGLSRQSSTLAANHDLLFWFITWLCVFFFVLLMGLGIFFTIKYRRRPGVPQQRCVAHNTPLELLWSLGPLVILIGIFFWAFDLYMDAHVAPAGAEEVTVVAQKWNWSWTYDNGAATREFANVANTDVPVFAVPAGKPVKLIMTSRDVIHALYVPDFRTKIDVFPGRYTTLWFEAMEAGEEHYLFCAEYCGDQHSQMAAVIKVLEPGVTAGGPPANIPWQDELYGDWKSRMAFDDRPLKEVGATLYITKACNSCHSIDGSVGTGPSWLNVYGSEEKITGGTTVTVDENYIRESILVPAAKIVEGFSNQMNSFQGQLTEREIMALITYIKSLSEEGRVELEAAPAE